jgi:hypothetical protein
MNREIHDCHDCQAKPDEAHEPGCDVARCMWTGRQAIACDAEDHDCGEDVWTGEWPGDVECREYGFWCYEVEDPPGSPYTRWVRCGPDHPDATEDLTRLVTWCRWDREQRKWVLPDGKLPAGMPT